MRVDHSAPREKDGTLDSRIAGQFLKHRIQETGMSYAQFADLLGVSPSYLSNVLNGRNSAPRTSHFKAIAAALKLTREELEWMNPNLIFVEADGEIVTPMKDD